MVGQLENDPYLSNAKAWDVGLVQVDVQKQESMYLQVHQIYHDPPSSRLSKGQSQTWWTQVQTQIVGPSPVPSWTWTLCPDQTSVRSYT